MDIDEKYQRRLEANRKYRREHKEILSEKAKIYYLEHKEKILEKQRERNRKECDDLRKHRLTLREEIQALISTYDEKISKLKQLLKDD